MHTTFKAKHRILSLALALCLALGMTLYLPGPVEVQAANVGIEDGRPPDIAVYETVIGFAGHQWSVIGDENSGVKTDEPNHITLLLEKSDTSFGTIKFRNESSTDPGGWKKFDGYFTYFYEGEFDTSPNEYRDSTLHREMMNIANDLQLSAEKEYGLIVSRDIGTDGISGKSVGSQDFWPLSVDEWRTLKDDGTQHNILAYGNEYDEHWWMRTIGDGGDNARTGATSGQVPFVFYVYQANFVRPAFQLNLESVLFTSDASGAGGKPSGLIGGSLAAAQKPAPTGAIKLTVEDENQTLDVTATISQETQADATLTFGYQHATTGAKQWVSCFLENQGSGDDYYGKLLDMSGSPDSGDLSIPLTGVADGTYTLHIFSEQDNGDNYTDFASKPVTMKVEVNSSVGTVSEFDGHVLSNDASLLSVAGEAVTTSGGAGTKDSPYTASIALPYGVSGLGDIDLTAAPGATAALYDSTYSARQSPVSLAVGDNSIYVKVTAEDMIGEQYYHITATRDIEPEEPYVARNTLSLAEGETIALTISLGRGGGAADSATITSNKPGFATVDPPLLDQSGDVAVTGVAKGEAVISIGYSGGCRHGQTDTVQVTVTDPDKPDPDKPDPNPGGGTTSRDRSSSSGSSTPDSQRTKTTLPASAFSWDGRTLTIDHDSITSLGLLSVRWDDATLTRGTDYGVYSGSVIIRFSEAFMAAQKGGDHTVRVEFLNHTGEATVTVGDTGLITDVWDDNDTHNPSTGGYPDGSYPGTDNPNTGGERNIWPALLLGSLGGIVLVARRLKPVA